MKEYKTASEVATSEKAEDKIVLIKVTEKTRERIKQLGIKGDTYEVIISKLLSKAMNPPLTIATPPPKAIDDITDATGTNIFERLEDASIEILSKIEFIAAIRHIGWITYQIAAGQQYNQEINKDQWQSLIDGVQSMLKNPHITPEKNHDNWMQMKATQGWTYGKVKDFGKKTHPDLVPYDKLPEIEKRKDIANGISHRLALELWNALHDPRFKVMIESKDSISEGGKKRVG